MAKPNLPTRALIVEDSQIYRRLLANHLRDWGFDPIAVESGSQAWKLLRQPDSPRLVLLDWVMPDLDGIELCRLIRTAGALRPYVYIILLTGKDGKRDMLEAMSAGVDDYLIKPFDEAQLQARIMVGKRILELQEQLIAANDAMRYSATHDTLTGLMSRGEITEFLNREVMRGRRQSRPVGIILADIDHFKSVNDSFGHLYGDEALRETARRLRAKLRVYDGVGRYGGEEFLMILPGCDLMTTIIRADEVRGHVCSRPVAFQNISSTITVSMGVSTSAECSDSQTLLEQADTSLYEAKKKGRNRVEHVERIPLNQATSNSRQAIESAPSP